MIADKIDGQPTHDDFCKGSKDLHRWVYGMTYTEAVEGAAEYKDVRFRWRAGSMIFAALPAFLFGTFIEGGYYRNESGWNLLGYCVFALAAYLACWAVAHVDTPEPDPALKLLTLLFPRSEDPEQEAYYNMRRLFPENYPQEPEAIQPASYFPFR